MTGDKYHRKLCICFGKLLLQVQTTQVGQTDVEHQTPGCVGTLRVQKVLGGTKGLNFQAQSANESFYRRADDRVVVHNKNYWSGFVHGSQAQAGRVNSKVAPSVSLGASARRPPWASTMERQIGSPIPMPAGLVVKKASKMWEAFLGSSPAPVSCTTTSTLPDSCICDRISNRRGRPATEVIASMPFKMRFKITCCNWMRSANTRVTSGSKSICVETRFFSSSPATSARTSKIISLISTRFLAVGSFFKSARTRVMTSAALVPASVMSATASRTSSRLGGS